MQLVNVGSAGYMKTVAERQGRAVEVQGDAAEAGPGPSSGASAVSWDARDQS